MAIAVSVDVEGDRTVVRHRADAPDADHLRRAGERLELAAHPGVVAVLSSEADAEVDGWLLRTAHAGHPLTAARAGSPERLAALAAWVGMTLADLHDRGVVHGRITASRILVGPEGRAVLSGFGAGPGPGWDGTEAPHDDVAALGRVVADLIDGLALTTRSEADRAAALHAVALRAQADPPSRRPTARRFVAEVSALAGPVGDDPPARATRARRVRSVLGFAVGATLALALFVSMLPTGGDGRGAAPGRGRLELPEPSHSERGPSGPTAQALLGCVGREGRPAVPPDCGHSLAVDGTAVLVDGVRSTVGQAGDEIAVADWGCDGVPRPALLRPSTGEVLVFSGPAPDGQRSVAQATRVEGATGLVIGLDRSGCIQLSVRGPDGRTVDITALT